MKVVFAALAAIGDLKEDMRTKALTLDPASSPALVRLMERLEPALRQRFLAAIRSIQNTMELEALASALQSGNISQAEALLNMQTWPEKFGGLAIDLRAGFQAGSNMAIQSLDNVGMAMAFTYVDTYTVEFARQHLPKLVQAFKIGAREMVRQVVTETVEGQWTPFEAAQSIREWIGLTAQQSHAVAKFERDLMERGIAEEKIAARVAKQELAQLKLRAEMIARTEIQTAANVGQLETWREAIRQGLLPQRARKRWITANDERLCPECEAMGEADPIPIEGYFQDDTGAVALSAFDDALTSPPLHPRCRCSMVIELD